VIEFFRSNGILGKVPGGVVAAASQSFPRPGPGQPAERHAVVDVEGVGRVRITYKLTSSTHHRITNWSWLAMFAEAMEEG
jgi:hypothetical protein